MPKMKYHNGTSWVALDAANADTLGGLNAAGLPVSTATATAIGLKSDINSPTFTGTPSGPTAAVNTNTTQLATTAFVNAEIANDAAPVAHVGATGSAHGAVTTSVNGFMLATDKTKLDTVATNANNYSHPANHAPSIITQDASNRFVTDTEKTTWNAKVSLTGTETLTNKTLTSPVINSPTGITASNVGLGNVTNESKATMFTSPTFTGTPLSTTAAVTTNTTQIATTAFVKSLFVGGSSTFNTTTGVTITHNIGSTNYRILITPTSNSAGYLGEFYAVKSTNTVVVYCTGSTTTATFDYLIFKY